MESEVHRKQRPRSSSKGFVSRRFKKCCLSRMLALAFLEGFRNNIDKSKIPRAAGLLAFAEFLGTTTLNPKFLNSES